MEFALLVAGGAGAWYLYQRWSATAAVPHQFGTPLPTNEIPLPLRSCFEYFESDVSRRRTNGLFRLSGSHNLIRGLRESYNRGEDIDLSTYEPVTVCCVMKEYLRLLPDPVIPKDFYHRFLELGSLEEEEWVAKAKELFDEIPPHHHAVCVRLFHLLASVGEEVEFNQMGPSNLAKVLFPILMSDTVEISIESFNQLPIIEKTVYRCIVHHDRLFE